MFEQSVEELDATATADALVAAQRAVLEAEAALFVLAAHWADVTDPDADLADRDVVVLPGQRRRVPIRRTGCVEGCPLVDEYAAAELAALTGRSTVAGQLLMADAVAVRHRHPQLWSAVQAGTVPTWVAAKVARRCIRADLTAAQAEWVDAETTPSLGTLPTGRFLDLVDAKIIQVDPDAAAGRAKQRSLATFVHAGQVDEDGLRTLVARASAGDVTYLVAVIDRIAHLLAERGDHRKMEVLRAEALRVLANPAHALALLTEAALADADPQIETPGDLGQGVLFPHGTAGGMVDATGAPLPASVTDVADLPELDDLELATSPQVQALLGNGAGAGEGLVVGTDGEPAPESVNDPALLERLITALQEFDSSTLDPVTVVHVHLSEATLTTRHGTARCEGIGPMVLAELRDWLAHPIHPDHITTRIHLRPVLDAATVVPVDRYEVPAPMSELATLRTPYEAFPFGTLGSRGADNDHARPYVKDGPPGQTSLENLAKLSRYHHRLKTNGHWILHHPDPGTYWWRTPHGHWFLVDPDGTHWHGRDPDLDQQYRDDNNPAA
ncbi:hypothetical protein [Nocardioides caldifontis]|uniref:hypothetical protein n=1 Tax=Nocardioides caldifontis TaxID=2588938 RepID=UPI0011E0683C|nr:hypothetical protein [Nocardioides caldifontis]